MISLLDIARRIDDGSLTPHAALRDARERIASLDHDVQAIIQCGEIGVPAPQGALRGIAVGVKDIIDVAGLPTRMGSPLYEGNIARADAPVVAALRRAGAVPLAKTSTTPFAFLDPTPTRNPRHPGHTPGGSSSGSAAAVAAGMLPLALGTQTGGSVIRPASFCGVTGMKPSFRLIPSVGVKCYSWTLDTVGLFAASVADVAFALAAMTGRDDLRLAQAGPGTPRIGVITQDFAGAAEPEGAAALEAAARAASRAGARVQAVSLPAIAGEAWRLHGVIQDFEAAQALAWEYDTHREALPPLLGAALDQARTVTPDAYDAARRVVHQARKAVRAAFDEVDVLLTLSAPGPAPETLASTGDSRFNRLWTLLGNPCVSVPGLHSASGLSIGVQIVAPFGFDARALRAAEFLEASLR